MHDGMVFVTLIDRKILMTAVYETGPSKCFYVAKEPCLICPAYDVGTIGEHLKHCLTLYEHDGPWPDDDASIEAIAAGYESYEDFRLKARDISVVLDDNRLHIYTERPHIFLPLASSVERIGHAVLRAFGTSYEQELKYARRTNDRA